MSGYLTRGMVVLADGDPATSGALFAAGAYTPRTVVVAASGHADVPAAQMVHPKGGASIDTAFQCAADDTIPWVAMRRDWVESEPLLSQVLEATGRRTRKDLPGFCVLLAGPQPRPIGRILTVLDRADGQPSGLLILAAVATAQATGAELDVLLIGAPGESLGGPANIQDSVQVTRDKELYDQAIRRATESGLRANWITAEDVDDPRALVLAQVAEGNYDLVIDDLGSVSLGGRIGRGGRIARAVAPDGPAAVVRALLEQTDVPLAIILDGVRLGLIPPAVLKGGAGTILALGLIASAAPAATASASELSAQQTTISQTADSYEAALQEAADLASPAEVEAALVGAEETAAEEGAAEAAPTEDSAAQADDATVDQEASSEEASSEEASSEEAASEEAESPPDSADLAQVAPAELAPEDVAPVEAADVDADDVDVDKDVESDDVDKVEKSADKTAAELKDAEKDFEEAQEDAVRATEDVDEAAATAEAAAEEVADAEAEYQEVTTEATEVVADATGVSGGLPGGATAEDLAEAEDAQAAALAEVEEVGQVADEALAEYNEAALDAAAAQADLDAAALAVTEADAAHQEASATADATEDAYQEVMAEARITPVEGASVGTHYGASGSVWSTGHHTGVDYSAPEGTEVMAAASGTVVEVGYDEAYGNRIVIEHEDGYYTTYNHLSDIDVEVGQEVTAGDHIGEVGNTGNSYGSHLHFEVTTGGDGWSSGSFEDPEVWLEGG